MADRRVLRSRLRNLAQPTTWVVGSPAADAAARACGYRDAAEGLNARVRVRDPVWAQAVNAVLDGETRAAVARRFGVTDVAVGNWVHAARPSQSTVRAR
ncbi:hypothetical protein [Actinomadura litoris]|uniref:hypothetical protein n=1 Tax=Actinomadura litoris TaxID=2678616 RepID=UPI001FA6CF9C|nr:hypothetical protein [Actinomadura litoris]